MIQTIKYLDVVRETYEQFDWKREDVSRHLEEKQIINIETLKHTIRFWYKED